MANNKNQLTYALKDERIIHISEVESGLKCNCICPACGESLIARKGEKMMHHFAHKANSECEYGYQTSLHLAAKDILSEHKTIMLPEVILDFRNHGGSYKKLKISEPRKITFDRVILEKKQGEIIPDVIAYSGEKKIYIEIYVTHSIDENKLNRIRLDGISTIEVDLSKTNRSITKEDLTEILLTDNQLKKWIYNNYENMWYNRFISHSIRLNVRGSQVYNCPISKKIRYGKPYAVLTLDCFDCVYCTDIIKDIKHEHTYLLCAGKERLADIKDFSISLEERVKITDAQMHRETISKIANFICPFCEGDLQVIYGKEGESFRCSNQPYCRFRAYINPKTGEFVINS